VIGRQRLSGIVFRQGLGFLFELENVKTRLSKFNIPGGMRGYVI
jgi:hypothetical protein